LKIQEKWQKYGERNAKWPEWEVFPTSPWNYGLMLDAKAPAKSFRVVKVKGPVAPQPWTAETAPIRLTAQGRKIPGWKLDSLGLVGKLQPSPVRSGERAETIELVPMGAARLRISMFPVIGNGADAREW
jgi:hypothetical protein